MILLFSTAVVSYAQTVREVRKSVTSDGEYVGLERMPNLTPEDRDTEWFHENTLLDAGLGIPIRSRFVSGSRSSISYPQGASSTLAPNSFAIG